VSAVALGEGGGSGGGLLARAVFLTDFVHIAERFEELAPVLLDPEALWLPALSERTGALPGTVTWSSESDALVATIRLSSLEAGGRLRIHDATLSVRRARFHEDTVIVPITLEPAAFERRLLPKLDADLELTAFGEEISRLGITGRYRAPLGTVGARIDKLGMHRLAESSIRGLLRDVEATLLQVRQR
jgi:hypothetical protein